jgi:hypothetical protein
MPELSPNQREFIENSWKSRWDWILQTQNQVVNWIFAVHGGGIAGLLTYAASKNSPCSLRVGLAAFSLGLVLIVLFGVCMYYFETHYFSKFRADVDLLFTGKIDWIEFSKREEERPNKYRTCEYLAWSSGFCGLVGMIMAVITIL